MKMMLVTTSLLSSLVCAVVVGAWEYKWDGLPPHHEEYPLALLGSVKLHDSWSFEWPLGVIVIKPPTDPIHPREAVRFDAVLFCASENSCVIVQSSQQGNSNVRSRITLYNLVKEFTKHSVDTAAIDNSNHPRTTATTHTRRKSVSQQRQSVSQQIGSPPVDAGSLLLRRRSQHKQPLTVDSSADFTVPSSASIDDFESGTIDKVKDGGIDVVYMTEGGRQRSVVFHCDTVKILEKLKKKSPLRGQRIKKKDSTLTIAGVDFTLEQGDDVVG